ncbi:MAG: hypothetical protein ACLFUZ_02605 [Candidatus Micrarchaeia archaeon]
MAPPRKIKLSTPIAVAPYRQISGRGKCKWNCGNRCIIPQPQELKPGPEEKKRLKKGILERTEQLQQKKKERDSELGELHDLICDITQLLSGSVLLLEYDIRMNALCGGGSLDWADYETEAMPMQVFSIQEMRELMKGHELNVDIYNAHFSLTRKGPLLGMDPYYAALYSNIACLDANMEEDSFETLMRWGGATGLERMAHLLGEPRLDRKARNAIINSFGKILNAEKEPENMMGEEPLIVSLSRFSTNIRRTINNDGKSMVYYLRDLGVSRPNPANIPPMMDRATEQLFQGIINISDRMATISQMDELPREKRLSWLSEWANSLLLAVETIGGNGNPRLEHLEKFSIRKSRIMPAPGEMDAREQMFARHCIHVLEIMGHIEGAAADAMFRVLNAETDEKIEIPDLDY